MERDVAALREAGSLAGACGVGETFPNFELRDQKGRSVSLDEMLKSGYAVLAFVRGGWCPYCNLELRALHNRLKEMESLGATLAAVSPEVPDREVSFANLSPVAFPVLYDENNRLAKRLRITCLSQSGLHDAAGAPSAHRHAHSSQQARARTSLGCCVGLT